MVKHSSRWVALGTLGIMALSSFGGLAPAAHAGSKGRRNVMYGAAAVTAYGLLTHRRSVAAVGAIGTGIAYHNYRAAKSRENRRRDAYLRSRSRRMAMLMATRAIAATTLPATGLVKLHSVKD